MFEQRNSPLLPFNRFLLRIAGSFIIGIVAISIALAIGMSGYHWLEGFSWIDSFANAAMILSGMGPLSPLSTSCGKIFAGFYALFSGLAFITITGLVLTPIAHRLFHHFHLERSDRKHK